jgi:hypothetical protein
MEAEYDAINRDLDHLLRATSLASFATLHTGLTRTIKSIFASLDEPDMTLDVVQTIATQMKNCIVCGPRHILYVRVIFVTDSTDNYVQKKRQLEPLRYPGNVCTFDYLIQNNCVYSLDVTSLCAEETDPLYLYDRDVSHSNEAQFTQTDWDLPDNPYLLSPPPRVPSNICHIFPGTVRLNAVRLTNNWHGHDYQLREEDETVVVCMQFRVMSVHGTPSFNAQQGIPLLLARLSEHK